LVVGIVEEAVEKGKKEETNVDRFARMPFLFFFFFFFSKPRWRSKESGEEKSLEARERAGARR